MPRHQLEIFYKATHNACRYVVRLAGPSNLIAFAILCALRIRAEERMMVEEFGDEYAAYSARTKRLIPGVW